MSISLVVRRISEFCENHKRGIAASAVAGVGIAIVAGLYLLNQRNAITNFQFSIGVAAAAGVATAASVIAARGGNPDGGPSGWDGPGVPPQAPGGWDGLGPPSQPPGGWDGYGLPLQAPGGGVPSSTIEDIRKRVGFSVSDDFIKSFLVIAKPDAFFQDTSRSKEQQNMGLSCLFQVMQAKADSPGLQMYSDPWGQFLMRSNILRYWCDLFVLIPEDQRERVIECIKVIVGKDCEGRHLAKIVEVASKLCGSREAVVPDFSSVIDLIYTLTVGGIWSNSLPLGKFEETIDGLSKRRDKNQVLTRLSAPAWKTIFIDSSPTDRAEIIEYFMSLSHAQQEQLTTAVSSCSYVNTDFHVRSFVTLLSGGKCQGDAFFQLLLVVLQHGTHDDILPHGMTVEQRIQNLQETHKAHLPTPT